MTVAEGLSSQTGAPPHTWALTVGCTRSFAVRWLFVSSVRQHCVPGPALPPRPPQSVDTWSSPTVVPPSWLELRHTSARRGFGETAARRLHSLSTQTRGTLLCQIARTRFRRVAELAFVRAEAFLLYTTHTTYLESRTNDASVSCELGCYKNKRFYIKQQNVPTTLRFSKHLVSNNCVNRHSQSFKGNLVF